MLASIVINNYNQGRYLEACIVSASSQGFETYEVIVVDDGSTDGSPAIIDKYADRVKIIKQPNGGQGAAYNAGFAAASGKWILFLDGDDVLDSCALKLLVNAAEESNAVAVSAQLRIFGDHIQGENKLIPSWQEVQSNPLAELREFGGYVSAPGSGVLFSKKYLEHLFPLDAPDWRICADTCTILPAPLYGRVVRLGQIVGGYRRHGHAATLVGAGSTTWKSLETEWGRVTKRKQLAANLIAGRKSVAQSAHKNFCLTPAELRIWWPLYCEAPDKYCLPFPQISTSILHLLKWPHYSGTGRIMRILWIVAVFVVDSKTRLLMSGGIDSRLLLGKLIFDK